jgi:hypothetical protein
MTPLKKASGLLVKKPSELKDEELDEFQQLVIRGGEIDPDDLTFRLKNADRLAFVLEDGAIIAVGAIKNPTERHKNDISRKSKIDLALYQKELGYISVEPGHGKRGLGSSIVRELLATVRGPIFATSRVNNEGIRKILTKNQFTIQGDSWFSQVRKPSREGIKICLWTRSRA